MAGKHLAPQVCQWNCKRIIKFGGSRFVKNHSRIVKYEAPHTKFYSSRKMSHIDLPTAISYVIVTLLCTSLEFSPSLYAKQYANQVDRVLVQLQYPRCY